MFKKYKGALVAVAGNARNAVSSMSAKAGALGTALVASAGSAMASGGSSPGAAIAAELGDGPAEMGLVFAGIAVLLGLLVVWLYTRRAAK